MEPGEQFGEYRLVRRLGSGGQGEVFEAVDGLGLIWAVKIGHPVHTRDAKALASFAKEAAWVNKTFGAMPRDSGVFVGEHYGVWEDRFYIKMRLLKGEALSERLAREGRLTLEQALSLAGRIASAVAVAHEHNALHRDLKPENIFLERSGRVQVLDWGCIQLIEAGRFAASTGSGPTCTVGYAALEQYEPSRAPLSTAVDVYSLGVVLLEMLVGVNPFLGRTRSGCDEARTHTKQSAQVTRGTPPQGDPLAETAQPTARAALATGETGRTGLLMELVGDEGSTIPRDPDGFGQESWRPAGTLAAVIRRQVAFKVSAERELTRGLPHAVIELLGMMLEPEASRRLSDMGLVAAKLTELLKCAHADPVQVKKSPSRWGLPAAGALLMVLGALTAAFVPRRQGSSAAPIDPTPQVYTDDGSTSNGPEPPLASTAPSGVADARSARAEPTNVTVATASSGAPPARRKKAKAAPSVRPQPSTSPESVGKTPAVRPFFDRKD